ncbi:uncharacterized protein LOC106132349 [Amyelois transitella]|uniref:uncharacterized protein LOC106132349 n=1 Tax=Amyelois transitella TaxID=680683 RepID=UPI00298F8A95|nr:uncharacterized protein LOC106132349 [Amyelois transitella]
MALMRSRNKIPKGAVVLNEEEAVNYSWKVVTEWESLWDTWALRYGPPILGGINAISGIIINNHYRTKLKLGSFGFYSSVIPVTVMPGLMTILFHRHLVTTNMLMLKTDTCPICYEIRSAAIQLGLGVGYPMLLAPTSAIMYANRFATYRIPYLTDGPKKVFQLLSKITKPLSGTLAIITVVQLVASSVVSYFEMKNNFTVRTKLMEIENKILAETEESM